MKRFTLVLLALASAHCGGSVSSPSEGAADTGAPPVDTGSPEPWIETATCADVEATCKTDPAMMVLGHASGLTGLEGARVEFAVRYLSEEGSGLDVPHGVALGRTTVRGGAFATCVCVPHGANMYPQVAAVVYLPGTTRTISKEVARASFSQRYATLGDEDVAYALNAVPTDVQKEAALAAMIDRTATVAVKNLGTIEGSQIVAGLVADERPFASQVSHAGVEGGKVGLRWTMPGRAWASERLAFFVDRNANGRCDVDGGDTGALVTYAGTIDFAGKWVSGADLGVVCDALRPDASRE